MLSYLIKFAKKALLLLLIGMLLMGGKVNAEEKVTVSFVDRPKVVEAWRIRDCDVVVRIGEFEGKAGKRIYVNSEVLHIPDDIPVRNDGDGKGFYISEYDINKKVALKVYDALKAKGISVKLQEASGKSEDLNAAARISNASNPKLYLSLHHNYYNSKSSGYFTMYNEGNEAAKNIADRLSNSIINNNQVRYTGNRANTGYIGELNNIHNSTVGVLMELGFFSNLDELQVICSDSYTDYVSSHLADEIENVLNDYWK